MVHDPVMAYEDSTYYLFSTGMGIQRMTSKDRTTWTVSHQPLMTVMPRCPAPRLGSRRHSLARPLVAQLQLLYLWQERLGHRPAVLPIVGGTCLERRGLHRDLSREA